MGKNRGCFFILILTIAFSSNLCFGYVGLSPPRYNVEFEGNKEQIFLFDFQTDENNELEIYAEGDLAKYATLSTNRIQGSERVSVLIEFPNKIEIPGEHIIYIGAREVFDPNAPGVQVAANIRGTIRVFVPYPGKYGVMNLQVADVKKGQNAIVDVGISNLGMEDITLEGYVSMLDEKKKVVERQEISDWLIDTKLSEEKHLSFSNSINPGRYTILANLEYEGGVLKDEKPLRIGELFVDITSYTKYLSKNKLNKFDIGIESYWNDDIDNVYANVTIVDYPISFVTPSLNLKGFNAANLSGYFDTSKIQEDSFKAKVLINYQGRITEKIVKLKFKGTINYLLIGLILGIIFAIIIMVVLIYWIRELKRIKNEARKKFKRR